MIDMFAQSQGISPTRHHFKALFAEGMVEGVPVLLAKPQTGSGAITHQSFLATSLENEYVAAMGRLWVTKKAFDGTDLPCGILRLQPKGGFGRHNGSVDFVTMCFNEVICHSKGIGCPPGQMDPKAFVLQKFNKTSLERIDSAIEEGVEILKLVVAKGL
uniref:Uncharacterized protein n=1 Tax=Oryza barthii TaxID=65489 RepID=A0A0D3GBP8_9ORYZ